MATSLFACVLVALAVFSFGGEAFSGFGSGLNVFLDSFGDRGRMAAAVLFGVLGLLLFLVIRRSDAEAEDIIKRQGAVINTQQMNLTEARRELEEQKAAFDREIKGTSGVRLDLAESKRALDGIRAIQGLAASAASADALYDSLLVEILRLTESDYGFIAGLKSGEDEATFLRARRLKEAADGKDPASLTRDSLPQARPYGRDALKGKPVIRNGLDEEEGVEGFPDSHPALSSSLSMPLRCGNEIVGVIAVANRPGGYRATYPETLRPLIAICAELIGARISHGEDRLNKTRAAAAGKVTDGLLQAMSNNVISFNDEGLITGINPSAEASFLIDADDAIGLRIEEFLTLPDWTTVRHGGFHQYLNIDHLALRDKRVGLSATRRDGMVFPVEIQFVPYELDGGHHYYAVFRDLSEIREAEEALAQAQEETEWLELQTRKIKKEIAESRQAEQRARVDTEKIERSSRTKLELLANMSNELTTPLSAIAGFADSILKGSIGSGKAGEEREYVEYINETVARLLDYIKQTLDLSGVEDGKMGIDPKDAIAIGNYARFSASVRRDHDLIEALFQRALEADPGNPTILSNYSQFRTSIRNDHEREDDLFKYAIEADPESALAHGNYAVFLSDVRKHPERAEEYYKNALRLEPDNAENLANYAKFLTQTNKYHDRAETYFKRAMECDPDNPRILGEYARFLLSVRGNENLAGIFYQQAIEASDGALGPQLEYAMFLLKGENIQEGLERLQKIVPDLKGEDLLKAQFYIFAYSRAAAERTGALEGIRDLLQARIRSPLFEPLQDVRRLADEGHQDAKLLETLADVITVRQDMHALDAYPKWAVLRGLKGTEFRVVE